jgi:hypothetical protein
LQATDEQTRARVAREGGKASHSGRRKGGWMNIYTINYTKI